MAMLESDIAWVMSRTPLGKAIRLQPVSTPIAILQWSICSYGDFSEEAWAQNAVSRSDYGQFACNSLQKSIVALRQLQFQDATGEFG